MKKKGFTLVEIIVVIALIAFIGTISFFGIRLVSKNIKVSKLEQIEDKIFEAVSVYIETNKEAKTNLYNSKNGIYVPLNVLQNEGLIDFQDIKINKNDYVLTMLGSPNKGSECIDTTTIGSWDDGNKTIYLCATASGTTNIQMVGGQADNISKIERERYYFIPRTSDFSAREGVGQPPNYVKYNDNGPYRILYIDTDDSLILIADDFGSVFTGLTQPIATNLINHGGDFTRFSEWEYSCEDISNESVINEGITKVSCCDAYHSSNYKGTDDQGYHWFEYPKIQHGGVGSNTGFKCESSGTTPLYKVRLKTCMKIISGTGRKDTPYIIDDSTC